MKLPKFLKENKNENPAPPWMEEMTEGDFITCNTVFKMGGYWDTFDKYTYPCEEKGDITYYVFDPVKHGADPNKCLKIGEKYSLNRKKSRYLQPFCR